MNLNIINYIFTGFAVVMCFVMAYFSAFTNVFGGMAKSSRQILAVVLVSYAAFRIYRMLKSIRQEKSNTDEI